MKAIIPLSPPSYKQGNLPRNVKDLCTYARNLQEQVDFTLGQLQKGVETLRIQYDDSISYEQGASGIWTWKKYSDGTADCWGVLDVGNVSADKLNEWGALYEAVISSGVDFPFAFTNPPCLIRGISTTNGAGMVMEYTPTAGNTGKTSLVRTSKAEVAGVKIHFHASGRWK